ncbi:hypothetical protein B0H13DRAFT_2663369 [Mycena leptocephala]|nr:hypothetical protein B0H13DRAFT_2663369 [Mycena leptocephala]
MLWPAEEELAGLAVVSIGGSAAGSFSSLEPSPTLPPHRPSSGESKWMSMSPRDAQLSLAEARWRLADVPHNGILNPVPHNVTLNTIPHNVILNPVPHNGFLNPMPHNGIFNLVPHNGIFNPVPHNGI